MGERYIGESPLDQPDDTSSGGGRNREHLSSAKAAASTYPDSRYIVAEGDVPKVEPTLRYFTELRASLKNVLDVTGDLNLDVAALITDRDRARHLARHLFEMVTLEQWRDTGGDDGQGHYEGDLRAAEIEEEIRSWPTPEPEPLAGDKARIVAEWRHRG